VVSIGFDKDTFESAVQANVALQDFKFQQRYGRQNGIHASPSVLINGLFASEASSSWSLKEWTTFLDPIINQK